MMTYELAAFALGFFCGGFIAVVATALAVFAYKMR